MRTYETVLFTKCPLCGQAEISMENIERVEESPLGFLIREKGSFEPPYFFPPLYDPLLDAVRGAMRNSKEKR